MGSSAFTKILEDDKYGDEKVKNTTDNNQLFQATGKFGIIAHHLRESISRPPERRPEGYLVGPWIASRVNRPLSLPPVLILVCISYSFF